MTMLTPHPWRGIRPWKRHSLVLLVTGLVYILIGVAYGFSPATPQRKEALKFALIWTDGSFFIWGMVWILAGVLAIVSARWPPVSETWGYTVLTGLAAGWSAFYCVGVIFGDSPVSNLTQTLIFGLLAFLWWAISGLTNPEQVLFEQVLAAVDDEAQARERSNDS